MPANKDQISMAQLERADSNSNGHLAEKIHDGDDALKILHTHYEPYTKEEELAVKRKIDRRLVPLMLLVNGIQFVDKMVGAIFQSVPPSKGPKETTQLIS